jgi:myo-inositol-1(or 4)-monophosphatase
MLDVRYFPPSIFMTLSKTKALARAVDAAKAAGKLMRQNLNAPKKINSETSHDIKLELDVRCQKLIERKLHAAFPDVAFLGEEGTAGRPDAEFRWVVDPIDGTVNFTHGIPHAAVSIALQGRRKRTPAQASRIAHPASRIPQYETLVGVVYDPFTDELWTAIRGGPARLNGRKIHASRRRDLSRCIVSVGFAKGYAELERAIPYFLWIARRVRKIRMFGSAALGLTYVASGRIDAYLERGISIWDIAAGGLIIECAGGKFWTEPIRGQHKFRMISSNGLVHDRLPVPR